MIRTASGIILLYLRITGFNGWASLWGTVYLRYEHRYDVRLVRHELCHLSQMNRDGKIVFMVKYLYFLLRYGYWLNPYEIEARAHESGGGSLA